MNKLCCLGIFLFILTEVLIKDFQCAPVLHERGKFNEETTSHITPNETLEKDPVIKKKL